MPLKVDSHPFDRSVQLAPVGPDTFKGRITRDYANMVGPFGGVIAAVLLNGVFQHPLRKGDPVSVTVNFTGPIADAPFDLSVRAARTNRSNQHWICALSQDGKTTATATAVLAGRAETWEDTELRAPKVPPPETIEPLVMPGAPDFLRCFDMRFVRGGLSLTGEPSPVSETVLWARDEPARPLDFLSLLSLSDIFIPRIFIRKQRPGIAGSVTMTTYFHADAETLARQGARPILGTARGQCFRKGYFDQAAELWSDSGELLATSTQMVYFKD